MRKNILIVEDDMTTLKILEFLLMENSFTPYTSSSWSEAEAQLNNSKLFAAIVDLNLPDIDGFDLIKRIRAHPIHSNIPIIVLTSNTDKIYAVLALELGADDYVVKPFDKKELISRIKANIRRTYEYSNIEKPAQILLGDISIDIENRIVKKKNTEISLTFGEFEILKILLLNCGKVFSREELLDKLWGASYTPETRVIDIHISSLRKKLDDNKNTLIETVRGVGYRLRKFDNCTN